MRLVLKKIFICLFLSFCISLFSTEFDTYFSMDNFHFNESNKIDVTNYDFNFGETITHNIADFLFLDAGFHKSIVSDYSIFTDVRISKDLFGFNIGIFTNFLNGGSSILTPGLNYGLNLIVPGIIVIDLDLNNTIPNTSALENSVNINNYELMLGFYLKGAIVSLNLESQKNAKGTILTSTSNISNKYYMNLDLFDKYAKYRISIDLGWHKLSRKVSTLEINGALLESGLAEEYSVGSAYIDSNFTLLITDSIIIDLGFLVNLIKLPLIGVESFNGSDFFWGMNCGIIYKL